LEVEKLTATEYELAIEAFRLKTEKAMAELTTQGKSDAAWVLHDMLESMAYTLPSIVDAMKTDA
jgi:hypothetical protein